LIFIIYWSVGWDSNPLSQVYETCAYTRLMPPTEVILFSYKNEQIQITSMRDDPDYLTSDQNHQSGKKYLPPILQNRAGLDENDKVYHFDEKHNISYRFSS
jgi:hypothetical protein